MYWELIASLRVRSSTLVTVDGHLLAVGGKSSEDSDPTRIIYEYIPDTNTWQVVSQMKTGRSRCAAALLPDNKLMVVGGGFKKSNEMAFFYMKLQLISYF